MNNPNEFNYIEFFKYLQYNNALTIIIAAMLSTRLNEIIDVFFESIIFPIINRNKINKIEHKEIHIYGAKLKLGKFILSLFKFAILIYLIYIVTALVKTNL